MTTRNTIIQRVLNLRELASGSSSEAEAFSAMRAAEKLMHSYRVEEAELALAEGLGEIKVEIVDQTKFDIGLNNGRVRHKVQACIWSIERFCEVEVVLKSRRGCRINTEHGLHVIGDAPDVEMFWWLMGHVRDSMDRSYNSWKRQQQAVGRGAKASFQIAFASAINGRLAHMTAARRQERKAAEAEAAKLLAVDPNDLRVAVANGDIKQLGSNMALVVASAAEVKQRAVQDAYKTAYAGVRLGTASGFSARGGGNAAAAGRSAGGKVGLGRPVGQSRAPALS